MPHTRTGAKSQHTKKNQTAFWKIFQFHAIYSLAIHVTHGDHAGSCTSPSRPGRRICTFPSMDVIPSTFRPFSTVSYSTMFPFGARTGDSLSVPEAPVNTL